MDPLDIVPFMGFIRNDEETIQIIAKAATIVPKACDILGISLSDSESDEDDTAEETGGRSPQSHQQINRDNASNNTVSNNADNREVQDARPKPKLNRARPSPSPVQNGEEGSHVRKSRKRCASTPCTLGQSTSSAAAARPAPGTLGGGTPHPPKKRRYPSISTTSGSGADLAAAAEPFENLSPEESAIRRKMLQDLEFFNQQVTKLAAIEREKHQLLSKFIQISDYLKKQQGRLTPPPLDDRTNESTATMVNDPREHDEAPPTPDGQDANGRDDDDVFFTEADLSIGAEETVVVEEEDGQGFNEEDTVGSLV